MIVSGSVGVGTVVVLPSFCVTEVVSEKMRKTFRGFAPRKEND